MNKTVLAPAFSANAGTATVPFRTDKVCGAPPFTDALTVHFPPLGAVGAGSVTVHEAPATAPESTGVALPPLPSAAVVKLDGHVPVNVDVALAWLEPAGACYGVSDLECRCGRATGGHDEVGNRVAVGRAAGPALNPRNALAGNETVWRAPASHRSPR